SGLCILPLLPETCECIGLIVFQCDCEWLLHLFADSLPLIKCIRRHQTAPVPNGFAEGGRCRDCLCFCVDRAKTDLWVLCPEGNKTPPHEHDFALFGFTVQSHHRLEGLRSDVPRRTEVGNRVSVNGEELGNPLLVGAANISTTHQVFPSNWWTQQDRNWDMP